jgi:hypothetical protein
VQAIDENVERVRQVSETLIKKHGGFDGWFRHLQALDRRRRVGKKTTSRGSGRVRSRPGDSEAAVPVVDEIVERVHQARDSLIKKHGGFEGWVKHLIAKSRCRELAPKRRAKPSAKKRRLASALTK